MLLQQALALDLHQHSIFMQKQVASFATLKFVVALYADPVFKHRHTPQAPVHGTSSLALVGRLNHFLAALKRKFAGLGVFFYEYVFFNSTET